MTNDSACNRAPCNTNCEDGPNGQNDCFIQYTRQCFDSNANPIMNQVCIDSRLGEPFFGEICPGIDSKSRSCFSFVENLATVRETLVNFESYSACLNPVRPPTERSPPTDPPLTTVKPGATTEGPSKSNCTMKTFWKCWWFWLIIALLIILVSLICHPL